MIRAQLHQCYFDFKRLKTLSHFKAKEKRWCFSHLCYKPLTYYLKYVVYNEI